MDKNTVIIIVLFILVAIPIIIFLIISQKGNVDTVQTYDECSNLKSCEDAYEGYLLYKEDYRTLQLDSDVKKTYESYIRAYETGIGPYCKELSRKCN